MDNYQLYNDIKVRTGGELYLGVGGPVRTGKSTFIKRFMDTTRTMVWTILYIIPTAMLLRWYRI